MRKFILIFCMSAACAASFADGANAYDAANSALSESAEIRISLAKAKRAAALENSKRAELEKAYEARISDLKKQIELLKKQNGRAYSKAQERIKKFESANRLLAKIDAFSESGLEELYADSNAVKILVASGVKILSKSEIKSLSTAQKYALLCNNLQILLAEDSKIRLENGITASGVWTRITAGSKKLDDGVFEAAVERSDAKSGKGAQ